MEKLKNIATKHGAVMYTVSEDVENHIHRWDEYQDFIQKSTQSPFTDTGRNYKSSQETGSGHFNTFDTWAECVEAVDEGWMDGLKKIRESVSLVGISGHGGTEFRYDVEGVMFDMGRVMEGHPECWMNEFIEDEQAGHKSVRIMINASCSAGVSSDSVFNRGAVIVSIVDQLEARGIRVEIWVVDVSHCYGVSKCLYNTVCVKKFDEALNLEKFAFQCANSDYQRRICFSYYERSKEIEDWFQFSGYGRPQSVYKAKASFRTAGLDLDDFDIIFDYEAGEFRRFSNPEKSRNEIKKELEKFGIEPEFD
jgi:hypothetical protein